MPQSLRSRRFPVVLCLLAGVATSACVQPDPPSVGMSKVEASLVFGLDAVPETVATPVQQAAAQILAAPAPVVVEQSSGSVETQTPIEFAKASVPLLRPPSSSTPRVDCPTAPITAAAEVAPQPRISGQPRPGSSKWRLQGFLSVDVGAGKERQEITDRADTPRAVRNFVASSADRYTFEVVQEEQSSEQDAVIVTTYEVNTAAVTLNPSDGVGTVATPGVGEPERGITIQRIDRLDPDTGSTLSSFAPTVGLLVLPLPVSAGDSFTTTAIDPRTGQTISRDSVVVGRERIDACGSLVDGWLVQSKERSTFGQSIVEGAAGLELELDVATIFATQYGGVPIAETIGLAEDVCGQCPFQLRSRVGQLEPDPPTGTGS